MYYYTSKEDAINKTNAHKLNWEEELKYLKVDVTAMPIIYKEQKHLGRDELIRACKMDKEKFRDRDNTITISSFCKYLLEEQLEEYMTERFRVGVPLEEFRKISYCYIGAFVGGNKDITYLDEEVFNKMYPGIPFYDSEGKARIRSYDVNSMYP